MKADKRTLIPVESGIKRPPPSPGRPSTYPWTKLKVGDSFEIVGANRASVGPMVYGAAKRYRIKLSIRQTRRGLRIWRVK